MLHRLNIKLNQKTGYRNIAAVGSVENGLSRRRNVFLTATALIVLVTLACGSSGQTAVLTTRLPTLTSTPLPTLTPTASSNPVEAAVAVEPAASVAAVVNAPNSTPVSVPTNPTPVEVGANAAPTVTPSTNPTVLPTTVSGPEGNAEAGNLAVVEAASAAGNAENIATDGANPPPLLEPTQPAATQTVIVSEHPQPTVKPTPDPTATPTPLPTHTPTATTEPVIETGGWSFANLQLASSANGLIVRGEMVNNTGITQELDVMGGAFYDDIGQIIADDRDMVASWSVGIVGPGERVPFEVVVNGVQGAADYELNIEAQPVE